MRPQSATSIADYKRCSILFYLCHVLRLRPIEKAESLRQGTNWHKCLEILTMVPGKCPVSTYHFSDGPVCPVCENTGFIRKDADMREALFRYMNEAYATCPPSIDLIDWETEQTILLYSAIGWDWYWGNDKVDTIAREVHFAREINSIYSRRGTIDRIIQRGGTISLGEYKSTSKPIDPGAFYWSHLKLDSQLTMYLIEARHMQLAGELRQYGIKATDPLISGMLYDVWHKPKIKPKKLTQANTKKFIASGEYFGEKFKITESRTEIYVNGVEVETSIGALPKVTKKNPNPVPPFAIRETPEMFGARLLADIRENPEKHFARKEIARTDQELEIADKEFSNIARLTNIAIQRGLWFKNEHNCDALWRCPYHSICFYNIDVSDGQVPEGFKYVEDR